MSYIPPSILPSASVVTAVSMSVAANAHNGILRENEQQKAQKVTIISGCLAGASVATALLAMYIEASAVAYLAFLIPLFTAPMVISQRRKLNRLPTLRHETNGIRVLVNQLQQENNQLHQSVTALERQCHALKATEEAFQTLCQEEQLSATSLLQLLQQGSEIQREMRAVQETDVLQHIMMALIRCDLTGEWIIHDIDLLVLRLQTVPAIQHVKEGTLRHALRASASHSVTSLYHITTKLLEDQGEGFVELSEPR